METEVQIKTEMIQMRERERMREMIEGDDRDSIHELGVSPAGTSDSKSTAWSCINVADQLLQTIVYKPMLYKY